MRTVTMASDHAGVELRLLLGSELEKAGFEVRDLGPAVGQSVDYPDQGEAVARAVAAGEADLGVLVCGTGIGMSIAANKVAGVRAALIADAFTGRMAREHNDANVICFGQRVTGSGPAVDALHAFLATSPSEVPRHQARVAKLDALDTNR